MENGYLFKDDQSGQIHVGKQAQNEENREVQESVFEKKRNEFLDRNNELQQSLWRGRDSQSMSDVKNSYNALNDFMNEEIPEDAEEFEARKNAIVECYDRLIRNCETYINGHKNPRTKTGKRRKAIVEAILQSASIERLNVLPAMDSLKGKREEGMIWGNLFGEMQENVDLCMGVYDGFEEKFPEGQKIPAGARTMQLAKVISGSYALSASENEKDREKGALISKMSFVWTENNMSEDLKKEYKQFRTFVTKILVNNYRTALAHSEEKKLAYFEGQADEESYRQYTLLMMMNSEYYGMYKALNELAVNFGEDPISCGVEGEEIFNGVRENASYFTRLKREKVQAALEMFRYYRRVEARSFLDGFVNEAKLDALLGESLKGRQNNAVPLEVKCPLPKEAGKEKLDGDYNYTYYMRKLRDVSIIRQEALGDAEGEDETEKLENVITGFNERYGDRVINHDLENSDQSIKIIGLNTSRILPELMGPLGNNMTKADIEALYDKLLSRSRIGTGEGKITAQEADREFMDGMNQLVDIYLDFLKRMEVTYGRLMVQMHPEDIIRQFGDEYYAHIAVAQDLDQIKEFITAHCDMNTRRVREFIFLADYFYDIHSRSVSYLSHLAAQDDAPVYEIMEGQRQVRDLLDVEKLDYLTGPQMTAAQKKKYNDDLKKRFHKKGGNWDSRVFSEFRGMPKLV